MSYDNAMEADPYWLKIIGRFNIPTGLNNGKLDDVERRTNEIIKLIDLDQNEAALKCCRELSEINSNFWETGLISQINAVIKTYIDEIDFLEIERDFEISKEKVPNLPQYYFNMGLFYIIRRRENKDIERAIDQFNLALKYNPDFAQAYESLALIYTLSQNWELGLDNCKKALFYKSELRTVLINLCMMNCSYELGQEVKGAFDFKLKSKNSIIKKQYDDTYLPKIDINELIHQEESFLIFIACDKNYFEKHLVSLILSLNDVNSQYSIHIHIFNPSNDLNKTVLNLRKIIWPTKLYISKEVVEVSKYAKPNIYYSSVRFCRLYQLSLANPNCKIIMLDADSLFRKSPSLIFETIDNNADIVINYSKNNPMWDQFTASLIYTKSTLKSYKFLSFVNQFIIHNLKVKKAEWFLDQVALFASFRKVRQDINISFFSERQVPTTNFENRMAIIWVVVNELKKGNNLYNLYKHDLIKKYISSKTENTPRIFTINSPP